MKDFNAVDDGFKDRILHTVNGQVIKGTLYGPMYQWIDNPRNSNIGYVDFDIAIDDDGNSKAINVTRVSAALYVFWS